MYSQDGNQCDTISVCLTACNVADRLESGYFFRGTPSVLNDIHLVALRTVKTGQIWG
jgi:hypothetical protein